MVSFPSLNEIKIRKAVIGDIRPIHKLLNGYGEKGVLLARPLGELYDHLRDFSVLVDEQSPDPISGMCALGICWEDLAEIRSLVVAENHQGKGFGKQLVETCLQEAVTLGLKRVFALTYAEGFFVKMGFKKVEKSVLPHKVWADCLKCARFPDCDETAMVLDFEPSSAKRS